MPETTVPLPKTGITIRRTSKIHYVYKVLRSYRNQNGLPDNERKLIGKLAPDDDESLIPNANYYELYGQEAPEELAKAVDPLSLDTESEERPHRIMKRMGSSFLIHMLLVKFGIDKILRDVFGPILAEMIISIAVYMCLRGNVIERIAEWCDGFSFTSKVTPQKAAGIFEMITPERRMNFFRQWVQKVNPTGTVAYDVTSISTYAKRMKGAEYGYNRDGESLPQINLGMYYSQETASPLFYVTYSGSIIDKSEMKYMMDYNEALGLTDIVFVMDKGFCKKDNVLWLHENGIKYVIAVDNFHKTTQSSIDKIRNDIYRTQNRVEYGIYSMSINSRAYGVNSTMHVYYSPALLEKQLEIKEDNLTKYRDELSKITYITLKEYKKYSHYFDIDIKDDKTFIFHDSIHKFENWTKYCGYFCLLSNTEFNNKEIRQIYLRKDVIEKCFDDLKNSIDTNRMLTHENEKTDGKIFCGFLSLIAGSRVTETVRAINASSGKRRLAKTTLYDAIEAIQSEPTPRGVRLVNPLSKQQRDILFHFGFSESDIQSYAAAEGKIIL